MNKKQLILLIVSLLILGAGIAGLFLFPFSPLYKKPQAKPISESAPVRISSVRGEIVELDGTKISVIEDDKVYTFPVRSINQVQKLVTGSIEGGDAQTVDAQKSDLKTGQQVLIIAERNLSWIRAIYIIK